MMDMSNCKSCGRLIFHRKTAYCEACQSEKDETFRRVRSFLSRHPGSTVLDIHNGTGIAIPEILEYAREFSASTGGSDDAK